MSVITSRHANCLMFEEESTSPIFSLKWAKNCTPLSPEMEEPYSDNDVLKSFPSLSESTPYKDAILAYIVRKLCRKITCEECYQALLLREDTNSVVYNLTKLKDDNSLFYPSGNIMKILKVCDVVFKGMVSGNDLENPKIINNCNLKYKLRNKVLHNSLLVQCSF